MDVKIQARIYDDYEGCIDALAEGRVDFTRFGPVSYVLAKAKNPQIQLLAMESNFGSKYFNGVIFVKNDSSIQSLTDVKGKSMAFGNKNSTTGRYLAQANLKKAGIVGSDLKEYGYLGKHDVVALAVYRNNYQVGAVNENTFNKYKDVYGLRSLATFSSVTKPWIAREGLDEDLFNALQTILLDIKDMELLRLIKRSGLIEAKDSDYDQVREAMSAGLEFPVKKVDINDD